MLTPHRLAHPRGPAGAGVPRWQDGTAMDGPDEPLPPGQYVPHGWPVLHYGRVPRFRPERWEKLSEIQKSSFIPFSTGPRACVGRNVAEMEMALIASTVSG